MAEVRTMQCPMMDTLDLDGTGSPVETPGISTAGDIPFLGSDAVIGSQCRSRGTHMCM